MLHALAGQWLAHPPTHSPTSNALGDMICSSSCIVSFCTSAAIAVHTCGKPGRGRGEATEDHVSPALPVERVESLKIRAGERCLTIVVYLDVLSYVYHGFCRLLHCIH